jgi:TPR repeat protein
MYANGLDVPQDYAEAAKWLRRAADRGDAQAQHELGLMYIKGKGVPRDDAEAMQWFHKAADQGDPNAQYLLGLLYDLRENYAEAVKWFRKAAEQGAPKSQHQLGLMYDSGHGVPQDYVQAHMWLNLAAARFTDTDMRNSAVKDRNSVAAKMTPAQLAEAQKLAREWKSK